MREARNYPDFRVDALALALAPGVGPRGYGERANAFGSPAHAFAATVPAGSQSRLRDDALRAIADGERRGARFLMLGDSDYPASFLELGDPPPFLFILGDLSRITQPAVAIVGTRRATSYGERVTTALSGALASAGATIVCGMARGIDAAAHRAALACGGITVAVLGTGVDVAYPVAHRSLHRAIEERGVVISEFPCGTRAAPGSFPRRNRLIAALTRMTLVIEAGEKSGALITADHATDLGRDIAAVPGQVDSPQSMGSNKLIRDGVHAVLSASDALSLVGLADPSTRRDITPSLHGDERAIWIALADGAMAIDLLTECAELTPRRALAAVTALELGDLIDTLPTGELRRRR